MISFIVIGKNESWRLVKCFQAVLDLVSYNKLKDFEIIYVDSDSTDNSISEAISNKVNKIIKITGSMNAAVARNAGASVAQGDILFFLDGDIEIKPFSLSTLFNEKNLLKYNYIAGYLDDINYDNNWNFINQCPRHYRIKPQDRTIATAGGAIVILNKALWIKYNGMDECLRVNEDRDLFLRMAKDGILGMRIAHIMGLHHTIPYHNNQRAWSMLHSGVYLFKGYMIRKHWLNFYFLKKFVKEDYSSLFFLISLLLIPISWYFIFLPFVSIAYKSRKGSGSIRGYLNLFLFRVIQDMITILSVLFFYPHKPIYYLKKIK